MNMDKDYWTSIVRKDVKEYACDFIYFLSYNVCKTSELVAINFKTQMSCELTISTMSD